LNYQLWRECSHLSFQCNLLSGKTREIFSIVYEGNKLFPSYAIDQCNNYRPVKGLQSVLILFDDKKGDWATAYLFAGINSYLGDQRLQDLLSTEPSAVLEAAKYKLV
jgi:hypothetical protein